ncbi:MAG: VCBS repeat-containing protein [Planctomycetaceae bacterium]
MLLSGVTGGAALTAGVDVAVSISLSAEEYSQKETPTEFIVNVQNVGTEDVDVAIVDIDLSNILSQVSWSASATGGAQVTPQGSENFTSEIAIPEGSPFHQAISLPVGSSIEFNLYAAHIREEIRENFTVIANISTPGLTDVNPVNNRDFDSNLIALFNQAPGGTAFFLEGAPQLVTENYSTQNIALGDINNDGHLDAVIAYSQSISASSLDTFEHYKIDIFLNNGEGEFNSLFQSITTNEAIRGMAVGDLNGDQILDIYISGETKDSIWAHQSGEEFIEISSHTAGEHTADVVLGDLDGDGDLDAYTAAQTSSMKDLIWLNDGSGNMTPSVGGLGTFSTTPPKKDLALGDVDGDGDLDVIVSQASMPNQIWLNQGDATYLKGQTITPANSTVKTNLFRDLDNDNDLDLVIGQTTTGTNAAQSLYQ